MAPGTGDHPHVGGSWPAVRLVAKADRALRVVTLNVSAGDQVRAMWFQSFTRTRQYRLGPAG